MRKRENMKRELASLVEMPIRDLAPREPVSLSPDASVREALDLLREHRIGCCLVTEKDRVVGIFTERDVLMRVAGCDMNPDETRLRDVMTSNPEALEMGHDIAFALNRMVVGGYRHIPIVDSSGRPEGVLSVRDIVAYFVDHFPDPIHNLPPDPDPVFPATEGA